MLSAFGIPTCLSRDPTIFSVANAIIGPIVHEFSHGFGLPDLYDLNVPPVGGVGIFSTMSSSQGWDFSAKTPGHLDCWCRTKIGWAEPHEIIYDGYYAIQPLEMSSQLYKISKGYPEGEYLLIENKQPILFDKDVDTGGKAPGFGIVPVSLCMRQITQSISLFLFRHCDLSRRRKAVPPKKCGISWQCGLASKSLYACRSTSRQSI